MRAAENYDAERNVSHHLKHLAMCAPMILVAAVLLATGSGLRTLVPLAGCMLMMALAMAAAFTSERDGRGGRGRKTR